MARSVVALLVYLHSGLGPASGRVVEVNIVGVVQTVVAAHPGPLESTVGWGGPAQRVRS